MSNFNDKVLKSVSEIVTEILSEDSHGTKPKNEKEKQLAALAEPTDKITHKDVLVGRGALNKEDKELDETTLSAKAARAGKDIGAPGKQFEKIAKSAAERYGSEESGKRVAGAILKKMRAKTNEEVEQSQTSKSTFSDLVEDYKQFGIKSLFNNLMKEEPSEEEFTKEVERQKRKAAGTAPESEKAKVSAAAAQGVVVQKEEIEQVEERTLTEPEIEKKEEIVKSMKDKMPEFKKRYGKRAKEVLYATATKIAKED